MNVLRDLTNSIAVRIKLIAFSGFQKNSRFFLKKQFFFKTKPIFQRYEMSYYFSCILQQIFIFGDFYKIKFFSKIPYNFFTLTKVWRFREVLLFQSLFTASLLHAAFFLKKSFFLQKTQHVFPSKNLKVDFLTIFICSMPF